MKAPQARSAADLHDNAYAGLTGGADDDHWAFGTGFTDPLDGVDTRLPADLDAQAHAALCLALADDALVLSQRLAEWVAHGPELEEEVALANIALDLLGQARLLYARAAHADPACVPDLPPGSPVPPEDRLAFFRDASEFRNVLLVELPRGDFAFTMVRLLAFSAWRLAVLQRQTGSADPVLAAVAAKGVKEVRYHLDHAAQWVVTLAGGTPESHRRTTDSLGEVVPYLRELEAADPGSATAARSTWREVIDGLAGLAEAGTPQPTGEPAAAPGGRSGRHTAHLAALLTELQSVARAHPTGRW